MSVLDKYASVKDHLLVNDESWGRILNNINCDSWT